MKMLRGAAGVAAIAAAMAATNAGAVNLSQDGIGEVAIAPFYTTRNNWSTLINLTNTSNNPIVVKVRFHEALNSRDVLDFNVALSANDVFTGRVFEGPNGPTFEVVGDQANAQGRVTCTVPSSVLTAPVPLNVAGFAGDTGPTGVDRMREGYIEFINMGTFVGSKFGAVRPASQIINVGNAIEQHDCAALDLAFDDVDNPLDTLNQSYILQTAQQAGEPTNAVKFNARLINGTRGVEAGGQVVTWANFYNPGGTLTAGLAPNTNKFTNFVDGTVVGAVPGTLSAATNNVGCSITRGDERTQSDNTPGSTNWIPDGSDQDAAVGRTRGSCKNLITAQKNFAFLEPSLNDAFPVVANAWVDALNRAVSIVPRFTAAPGAAPTEVAATGAPTAADPSRGVDALSLTIQRATLMNEWSTNPTLGVSSDWVVTFPTKGQYVDRAANEQAGIMPGTGTGANRVFNRASADLTEVVAPATAPVSNIPYAPFQSAWAGTGSAPVTNAKSCDDIVITLYDRAENQLAQSGVIVSPAPATPNLQLCYESNVITFNDRSAFVTGSASAASFVNRFNVDASALNQNAGWMQLTFNTTAQTPRLGGWDLVGGAAESFIGKPVIGFNLKVRSFVGSNNANVADNFASAVEHGYFRQQ